MKQINKNFDKIKDMCTSLNIPYSIPYSIILKNSINKNSNILILQDTILKVLPLINYTKKSQDIRINYKKVSQNLISYGPLKSYTKDNILNIINPIFCSVIEDYKKIKYFIKYLKDILDTDELINGYLIAFLLNITLKNRPLESTKIFEDGVIVSVVSHDKVNKIISDVNNVIYEYKLINKLGYIVYRKLPINSKDINEIVKLLGDKVEYCGLFENVNGILYIIKDQTTKGIVTEGRPKCFYKNYGKFIWHTHPNTSKFYPSVEDILKLLKHDQIYYSYIFTRYGYWIMYFKGSYNDINNPNLVKYINNVNTKMYFKTMKGREYNEESIKYYINKLRSINGFEINFRKYK